MNYQTIRELYAAYALHLLNQGAIYTKYPSLEVLVADEWLRQSFKRARKLIEVVQEVKVGARC